ncbi:hypothetical protein [Bifidobacterium sp. ESL0790]|uniref:hypothetical protein n=1 Tax=Bifidobacterium sp. ESL0790 TaxID=2983233 RepID=UPI0023F8FB30|nr:hypothetical protein [Bifidobacterium sp. ESL0790]WEV71807.1 hypothetical protein OZY47_04935 [Bifidobacterium sp. ESL0790]
MDGMNLLVISGACVSAAFSCSYVISTIKGTVKPNRVTWLLWSVSPMIATAAALSTGVTWSILPVFMSGFMPFLVFLSSFLNKKSFWKIGPVDVCCGALSLIALAIWAMTKEPNMAVLLSILSDALAALPTYIKIFKAPQTERAYFYLGGLYSATTSLIAAPNYHFSTIAFAVYLVCLDGSLMLSIILCNHIRKRRIARENMQQVETRPKA